MELGKFSFGIGDRFAHQGEAQLRAFVNAKQAGVDITPVWNKSHREHTTIGSGPGEVRAEADAAVKALGWKGEYRVDADHINLSNVDLFVAGSDFFTIDVADYTGKAADADAMEAFVQANQKFVGSLSLPGIDEAFEVTEELLRDIAGTFLLATREAGKIYRHIEAVKGKGAFITEVSMDETDSPQTPVELFFILSALAAEGIPVQTIAPKFTGRFNKGVDYVGDLAAFEKEFKDDLAVIAYAIETFGLPATLKLSVHSGSDKFSIYEPIRKALAAQDAGLHIKTAGTTWLEELIGLAESGGEGLEIAKEVYRRSLAKIDALCAPYATVIDINRDALPSVEEVEGWEGSAYAAALRHDPDCAAYNPNFRQLLHVGYKVAADLGDRYVDALSANAEVVGHHVTTNLFDRHIKRLFNL